MHGEHAVEDLRRDKIIVRMDELDAHDPRFNPADHEKNQGVEDIHDAQPFVIDGRNPFVQSIDEGARRCLGARPRNGTSRHRWFSSTFSPKCLQIGHHFVQLLIIQLHCWH
jgi:hypothetical protein